MITKTILILFLTLCGCSISYGQSKGEIIRAIKDDFKKINQDKGLKVIKYEDNTGERTDGGSEITGYFKGDTLYKIKSWIGFSFGVRQSEYYFKKGRLFFVYDEEKDFPWDNPKGVLNKSTLIPGFEGRYYLNNDKIVDVKSKGQKRFETNSVNTIEQLKADVENFIAILRAHKKRQNDISTKH